MGKQAPICNLFIQQAWWHKILSSQRISIKHGWPSEEHYTQSDNARDFLLERKPRFVGFNKNHWIATAKEQRAKQTLTTQPGLRTMEGNLPFSSCLKFRDKMHIFDKPFLFRDGECHWMKEEVPVCSSVWLVDSGSCDYLDSSPSLKFALKRKAIEHVNNIPSMQFFTGIFRKTPS